VTDYDCPPQHGMDLRRPPNIVWARAAYHFSNIFCGKSKFDGPRATCCLGLEHPHHLVCEMMVGKSRGTPDCLLTYLQECELLVHQCVGIISRLETLLHPLEFIPILWVIKTTSVCTCLILLNKLSSTTKISTTYCSGIVGTHTIDSS
jgi:hypothetical protein